MSDTVRFAVSSPGLGRYDILRPLPKEGDPWGILAPLRETVWGALLPRVTGDALSHALHGRLQPFLEQLGTPPQGMFHKVPEGYRRCALAGECIVFKEKVCHPCPKLPDCYVPPGIPSEAQAAANCVVMAWKEGLYVIVVEGAEFRL